MVNKHDQQEIDFIKPATYKIVIHGNIAEAILENTTGMQVRRSTGSNQKSIISMVGQISDQSQLTGIINMLYDMRMTVVSVNMLSEIID